MDLRSYILLAAISFLFSGTAALKCYDCTFVKPNSDNTVVRSIVNLLSSQAACREVTEEDDNDLSTKTCPRAKSGHVAKCEAIKGDLSFDATLLGFSNNVELYIVVRGCTEVRRDSGHSGCYKDRTPSTVSQMTSRFEDLIPGTHIEQTTFSGTECHAEELITDDMFNTGSTIVNSHNVLFMALNIAMMIVYTMIL